MAYAVAIFLGIFIAELGDKTQITTLLFASKKEAHPLVVITSACAALRLSSGIAVLAGTLAERYLSVLPLNLFSVLGFIGIGVWMLCGHFSTL